ncbi:pirin family protein [Aquibaculum sediminis]|uniref:pirin family protein n=1 Tax=Aquibaculum sediminis TaxID=3231907 RepID=UPI003454253F
MTTAHDRPTAPVTQARPVERRLRGMPASDGAGVKLTRIIGTPDLDALDPFLMLDEFGSDDPKAYIAGFPDHPHRGFETVTVMLDGRMRHRDNKGNEGLLGPGGVQWMTAGSGLVHSEMPEQEEGLMRGFQLWLNLPSHLKMTTPGYRDLQADAIPTAPLSGGATVRVIAGRVGEVVGAIALDPEARPTEPYLLDLTLPAGSTAEVPLPAGHAAFAYVYEGGVTLEGEPLSRGDLAILGEGDGFRAQAGAEGEARVLLAAARPLNEPVARYGPFVMNTRDELVQAVEDFRSGRF